MKKNTSKRNSRIAMSVAFCMLIGLTAFGARAADVPPAPLDTANEQVPVTKPEAPVTKPDAGKAASVTYTLAVSTRILSITTVNKDGVSTTQDITLADLKTETIDATLKSTLSAITADGNLGDNATVCVNITNCDEIPIAAKILSDHLKDAIDDLYEDNDQSVSVDAPISDEPEDDDDDEDDDADDNEDEDDDKDAEDEKDTDDSEDDKDNEDDKDDDKDAEDEKDTDDSEDDKDNENDKDDEKSEDDADTEDNDPDDENKPAPPAPVAAK